LTHGNDLRIRSTVFVLHAPNEFSGFTLISKLQLSVALRKRIPPTHKGEYD
jgi:hypothetical protein